MKSNNMTYTFGLAVVNYATEANYPAVGEADTLYTNSATDVIKYWGGTSYLIYVGPRPHH